MSFLVWACVHVWLRRAPVNGSPPAGKNRSSAAATQVLQLVETLREAGRLDSLQLLHFHLGSQMANIRDIATGVRESARFLC